MEERQTARQRPVLHDEDDRRRQEKHPDPGYDEGDLGKPARVLHGPACSSGSTPATTAGITPARAQVCFTTSRFENGLVIRSEEHTSELQSLMRISYAVFCFKKKNNIKQKNEYSK